MIIDPFDNLPASFEGLAATQYNAERLIAAGVPTAFSYMSSDTHQSGQVLQSAGNAVGNGVDHNDALAAITTVPAAMFGLSDLGSLERGKIADVVIWDGDPLEVMTNVDAVYIAGEEQSMESRQTKLRDRYISLSSKDKPFAYKP